MNSAKYRQTQLAEAKLQQGDVYDGLTPTHWCSHNAANSSQNCLFNS
ncbi:hypothetical protein [Nostoc sp.]